MLVVVGMIKVNSKMKKKSIISYFLLITVVLCVHAAHITSEIGTNLNYVSQSQYAEDHSTLQIPKSTESIVARSGEKGQYYVGQYYFSAPDGHIYWIRYIYDESGFHPEIGLYQASEVFAFNYPN